MPLSMKYRLDTTSAGKMGKEALSKLYDFIARYHYDPKHIAEIEFHPQSQQVTFAVIQHWSDGAVAYMDGQTVVEDETHKCSTELMLPFLGYARLTKLSK
jgi:hypothetical protein